MRSTARQVLDLLNTMVDNYNLILPDMLYYLVSDDVKQGLIKVRKKRVSRSFLGVPISFEEVPKSSKELLGEWSKMPVPGLFESFRSHGIHGRVRDIFYEDNPETVESKAMVFLNMSYSEIFFSNVSELYDIIKCILPFSSDKYLPMTEEHMKTVSLVINDGPDCISAQKEYIQRQISKNGRLMERKDIGLDLELSN